MREKNSKNSKNSNVSRGCREPMKSSTLTKTNKQTNKEWWLHFMTRSLHAARVKSAKSCKHEGNHVENAVVCWNICTKPVMQLCCELKWEDSFQYVTVNGDGWWCIRFEWDWLKHDLSCLLQANGETKLLACFCKAILMTWRSSCVWSTRVQSSADRSLPTNSRKILTLECNCSRMKSLPSVRRWM